MQSKYNKNICGAKARRNEYRPCMSPPMKNGRCRMHGGKSTGPKTADGKLRSARANLKHGMYTYAAIRERMEMREMLKWRKELGDL